MSFSEKTPFILQVLAAFTLLISIFNMCLGLHLWGFYLLGITLIFLLVSGVSQILGYLYDILKELRAKT